MNIIKGAADADASDLNHFDSVAVAIKILEFNQDGELVYVGFNEAAFRHAHWTREDVVGKTTAQLFPGPIGQIATKYQHDVVREKQPRTFDIKLPVGSGFEYRRTTLVPVLNGRSEVVRVVATTVDVTAEKEAINQRANSEALVSEIENFTALAAHDLRTPMTHITTIAEIIRKNPESLTARQLQAVEMLEDLAEQSMTLIRHVLERYRIVNAEHNDVQEFDLASLCAELFTVLDPFGVNSLKVDEQWVRTDKVAMQVVIGNLIDNALKHNRGRTIAISVSAQSLPGSDMLEVTIADNGKGFDRHVSEFLNDGQLRSSEHFGLAGIRRLIRSRDGGIAVSNLATGGAEVIFTVPGVLLPPDAVISAVSEP